MISVDLILYTTELREIDTDPRLRGSMGSVVVVSVVVIEAIDRDAQYPDESGENIELSGPP